VRNGAIFFFFGQSTTSLDSYTRLLGRTDTGEVLLKRLTLVGAAAFYALYAFPEVNQHFYQSSFLPAETDDSFTSRIIANCAFIWTIRLQSEPVKIIGDAALHHFEQKHKTIETN
jgi:ribosomal-protein-alanine N-acetyltransferase